MVVDIISEIESVIKSKLSYFRTFTEIADYKQTKKGVSSNSQKQQDEAQAKAEDWLKYEILYHFWKKGIKCYPELKYEGSFVDIILCPDDEPEIYIELKNYFNSGQTVDKDMKGVLKDINNIKDKYPKDNDAYFIILLPTIRKGDYAEEMVGKILDKFDDEDNTIVGDKIYIDLNTERNVYADEIMLFWIKRIRQNEGIKSKES